MEKLRRLMLERLKNAVAGLPGIAGVDEGTNPRTASLLVRCRTEAAADLACEALWPHVGRSGWVDVYGDDPTEILAVALLN